MYDRTLEMTRTKGWTSLVGALTLLWTVGCTQEEQVITTMELRDEDGTWLGCEPSDEVLDAVRPGDDCTFGYGCMMVTGACTSKSATCVEGKIASSQMSLLDCGEDLSSPFPEPRADTSWSDCAAALDGGQSGEPCLGAPWACAEPAAEVCCHRVATCDDQAGSPGRLLVAKVCAAGCQENAVDDTRAMVTSCPEALEARPNDPCTGEFACLDFTSYWPFSYRYCDKGALRVHEVVPVPPAAMP